MRLIDADRMKFVLDKNFGGTSGAAVLANLIDMQPTAYDVEAVVRELEKCEFCPAIITGDYCDVENRDCTECFREKAIEIVRGGRNERTD